MSDVLDTRALIAELGTKHGIRIDENDPAIAIVALNRLVLERAAHQISERIQTAVREFEESVAKVQRRAGQLIGEEFNDRVVALRSELQKDITLAGAKASEAVFRVEQANRYPVMVRWTVLGCLSAFLIFTAGVIVGWGYLPHH